VKKARERAQERVATDGGGAPLRQPLPGLEGLRDRLPSAPEEPPAETPNAAPPAARGSTSSVYGRSPRIVVRRERKGHGGKSATRIEGVVGSTIEIEHALREIKRALGCGATRDGADIVVQGAQGERVVAFLEAHGARKVVVGS